jgi:hypothetical protein
MSGFGLPKVSNPLDSFKGRGVENVSTRDMTPPRNLVKMSIEPVGESFNEQLTTLLLNASSIAESKSANWVKHYIPGQSDPLLQWISGSERTISFTAMVTKDIANNPTLNIADNEDQWEQIISPELHEKFATAPTVSGDVLRSLTNANFQSLVDTGKTNSYWSRSIASQLDFYRKLVAPRGGASSVLTKTPPLVYLRMGTILGDSAEVANMKFILATYSMNITEYSPELEPMKATVTFTFIEYVDRSKVVNPDDFTTPLKTQGPPKSPTIDNSVGDPTGVRDRIS